MNDGHSIGSVKGGVGRVSMDGQLSSTGCDIHLFIVCPWVDEDTLGCGGSVRESIQSSLDLQNLSTQI